MQVTSALNEVITTAQTRRVRAILYRTYSVRGNYHTVVDVTRWGALMEIFRDERYRGCEWVR